MCCLLGGWPTLASAVSASIVKTDETLTCLALPSATPVAGGYGFGVSLYSPRTLRQVAGTVIRSSKRALQIVWAGARKQITVALILEVVTAVAGIASLVVARRLLKQLRVDTLAGKLSGELVRTIIVIGALAAIVATIGSVQMLFRPLAGERVAKHIYRLVLTRLRVTPLEQFDDPTFHDRLDRMSKEGSERPIELVWAVSSLITGLIGLVALTIYIASIIPQVIPVMLVGAIPLFIASRIDAQAYYKYVGSVGTLRRRSQYLRDLLTSRRAAPELAAYGLRPHFEQRHEVMQEERIAKMQTMITSRAKRSLFSAAATTLVTVGALLMIAYRATSDRLGVEVAITVAIAVQQLGGRMQTIRYGVTTIYQNRLFLDDLTDFLGPNTNAPSPSAVAEPALGDQSVSASVVTRKGSGVGIDLELRNVTFTYPGQPKPAIQNVSLQITNGQVIALVGENGSGKTTLAKLIAGLYAPQEGAILVDGIDLASLAPTDRYRHAATVFQDFGRYALSAYDNVALGDVSKIDDDEAVNTAVKRGGLSAIIDRLPKGLETTLASEYADGSDLSSGQWQRFALARAFFRDSPLLVLDEPSAALDARAEFELFERVRVLCAGRTVILISHRLATVPAADQIVVMRAGEIAEVGTHDSLIAADGLYAELLKLQQQTIISGQDA